MRLQDLRDDLALSSDSDDDAARILARRVADLFDDCPDCKGTGELFGLGDPSLFCPRCGGTGIVPSTKYLGIGHLGDTDDAVDFFYALARCLFADGSPEGER